MLLCVIRGILYGTGKKHFSISAHHFFIYMEIIRSYKLCQSLATERIIDKSIRQ